MAEKTHRAVVICEIFTSHTPIGFPSLTGENGRQLCYAALLSARYNNYDVGDIGDRRTRGRPNLGQTQAVATHGKME